MPEPVVNLAAPPSDTPYLDPVTGMVSWQWLEWLQAARTNILNSYGTLHVTSLTASETISPKYVAILASGTITLTLPAPDSVFQDGLSRSYYIKNTGSGTVTLSPSSSETIDGAATKSMGAGVAHLLVTDGTNWFTYMLEEGVTADIQRFTSSGTWTMPAGWTTAWVHVYLVGAGGSGGSGAGALSGVASGGAGSGGGSGEFQELFTDLTANQTVTIGAGGAAVNGGAAGANNGNNGNNGGSSSFGSYLTAVGGLRGLLGTYNGAGGATSGRNQSAGIFIGLSITNPADLYSPSGMIGLKSGIGGGAGASGGIVGTDGESAPGYPAGGLAGADSATQGGNGGGGAASRFASGGAGGVNGVDGVGGNGVAGSRGSGGGGGGGAGGGTGSFAGGNSGAGGDGYCVVYAEKIN